MLKEKGKTKITNNNILTNGANDKSNNLNLNINFYLNLKFVIFLHKNNNI